MRVMAVLAAALAFLLWAAGSSPPTHAEAGSDDETPTLFDVLQALAQYYESEEGAEREAARSALDRTIESYQASGAAASPVAIGSVTTPTSVSVQDFYRAYRSSFDSPRCGNTHRPTYTSPMYFQDVSWRCHSGQWQLVRRPELPPFSEWIAPAVAPGACDRHVFYSHPSYQGTLSRLNPNYAGNDACGR